MLEFHSQLTSVSLGAYSCRFIYVNDGSEDRTQQILEDIAAKDSRVTVLQLSRNFGHQAALSAGLESSTADVVISMDGDGQHPVSLIPQMFELLMDARYRFFPRTMR